MRAKSAAGAYGSPWRYVAVAPSTGHAAVAITSSPVLRPFAMPPQVPTRIRRFAPSRSSSSTTMLMLGVPIPLVWTLTGRAPVGAGEPEQAAVVVHLAGAAGVEALADPAGAVGVAGQEDERGVVAVLGAKVDLWHAR